MLSAGNARISFESRGEDAPAVDARDLRVDPKSPVDDYRLYPRRQAPAVNARYGLASPPCFKAAPFFAHFTTLFRRVGFQQHPAERAVPTQVDTSGLSNINMIPDDLTNFLQKYLSHKFIAPRDIMKQNGGRKVTPETKKTKIYSTILFALFMSLGMSFFMSLIITLINLGLTPDFFGKWMKSFAIGFSVGFPVALVIAPIVRKATDRITGR